MPTPAEAETAYLTLAQLARLVGFSEPTVRRWKDQGRIPFCQPGGKGGHLRFPPDAVEACHREPSPLVAEPAPASSTPSRRPSGRRPKWMSPPTE